jgi:phosphoglycerate kinase
MREFQTLDDISVEGKTVLLRVDLNMPLDRDTKDILDLTRMKRVLPTIIELKEKKAKIVILSHQGRVGSWDFTSLNQHAKSMERLLDESIGFVDDIHGPRAIKAIKEMHPGDILFLDNVRKIPYETEKKSPKEHAETDFIKDLTTVADLFINDAFAAAHRKQCSLVGFTPTLPSAAGRLLESELMTLSKVVSNPEKPSVFLFGGAKYSDIMVTIEQLLKNHTADKILLTGLPANAFLKAMGYSLGEKNEEKLMEEGTSETFLEIKSLLDKYAEYIVLPLDFAVSDQKRRKEISLNDLPSDQPLFDIGEQTINHYKPILRDARTIFLSGPCGVFEQPLFMKGTKEIFSFVANSSSFSIVGGGHTVAAIMKLGLDTKISHISTGGGSLEKFMMGEKLPAVEALKQAKQKYEVKV